MFSGVVYQDSQETIQEIAETQTSPSNPKMDALKKPSSTFDPDKDIPDLSGKVYVVTGGSAGIGFGIMAHLLQHSPSKIYLLSNKEDHAMEAQDALKEWGDISKVQWLQCDLSSFKSTDTVARQLANEIPQLDALICNAGLGVGPYSVTEDGIESHMQVNHFAQAHLAFTLLPVLQRTRDSRLVFQSSSMHQTTKSDFKFESLDEMNQNIGPVFLYGRTKLAQILFMRALHRRMLAGEFGSAPAPSSTNGPWINCTHPGAIVTDQQDQAVEAYGVLGKVGVKAARVFMKDPVKKGCRSALFAATSEDVVTEGIQCQYIEPDREVKEPSDQATDEKLAANLWRLTKEVLESRVVDRMYTLQA